MTVDPEIGAATLVARAFMIEIIVEIARGEVDGHGWARDFLSKMTERIDGHEARMAGADLFPEHGLVHEKARDQIDALGSTVRAVLDLPPPNGVNRTR